MANIRKRIGKNGDISYQIRVFKGKDPNTGKNLKDYVKTWSPPENMSASKAEKEVAKIAALFEQECREGLLADNKQTLTKYAEYVIGIKERSGLKKRTIKEYTSLLTRINSHLGHMKIGEIRPQHLNKFYEILSGEGQNLHTGGKLSPKSILEYHRFLSTVFSTAENEMLIMFNPASRATPPKQVKKAVNYFQMEDIVKIRECLKLEPIKWQVLVNMLIVTGGRRGEVMGLKWDAVNFKNNTIHVEKTLLYSSDIGVYEDTTKNSPSDRTIKIPTEIMEQLKQLRKWHLEQKLLLGSAWTDSGYLFVGEKGQHLHPDSVNTWLKKFAVRNNLRHINPHAFRHTMASILYFNGVDSVSISKRLGHAKISTTTDIYSHIIKEADERASECIADVLLRSNG